MVRSHLEGRGVILPGKKHQRPESEDDGPVQLALMGPARWGSRGPGIYGFNFLLFFPGFFQSSRNHS